ncbi:hypothetical protein HX049_02915 [Myroides odoratimimus]|uniref:hypothetical protein n=1 Tax=Myroides odoratimimus TaxID=76832 RepID=UPI002574D87A|nr:hypothetical protein [Myroides odoratimimus]MDM1396130.1 hypothetical protein [Myroides odoratimimus]
MNNKESGWLNDLFLQLLIILPELPGLLIIGIGLLLRYWAKKGDAWMYETGGPGVFSNITWIYNTFGEKAAKAQNLLIAWALIFVGFLFVLIGFFLRFAMHGGLD